jgi:transposase
MVFGIIGWGVHSFLVYPRSTFIDAETYIECLKKCLLPILRKYPSRVFMQDNASAHNAAVTQDFFSKHHVQVLEWPATSPDLNPIENFWAHMKRKAGYFPPITSKSKASVEAMRVRIQKTIDNIPQKEIDEFALSFSRRLEVCKLLQGKYIQHADGKKLMRQLKKQ